MSTRLQAGVGAECSVLIKLLHPRKLVSDTLMNWEDNERLVGLVAIKKEKRSVNRKDQDCIIFRHDRFLNQELYCTSKFCKVLKEGSRVDFFADATSDSAPPVEAQVNLNESESDLLPDGFEHLRGTSEDIAIMTDMGFDVDDDNLPAPENVPDPSAQQSASTNGLFDGQSWGWNGICNRRSRNCCNFKASLRGIDDICLHAMTYLQMFLLFFPKLLIGLIMTQTNKCLR